MKSLFICIFVAIALLTACTPKTEREAWEDTITAHVGPPYLEQYRADKAAGRPSPWDYVEDDPALPRVLLIGDSISRAYTLPVRGLLAGKANVHRAPQNCLSTTFGVKNLDLWLGDGRWDVIHFNFGIHDKKTPVGRYERQLDDIAGRLQSTGATVIWASTTPTMDDAAGIAQRNKIAATIMARRGIPTDDLASFQGRHLPDGIHYTEPGNLALGEMVAASIQAEYGKR